MSDNPKFLVESILVCTGVYDPKNDLTEHLRQLDNPEYCNSENGKRRNSEFTDYFEKHLSRPDITCKTLKEAIQHIIDFKF